MKTVISFGEILWDLLPDGAILGGAPFNFAYRVNSLGDRGVIMSRMGYDSLGRRALKEINALGVDTSGIQWDEVHPTGTVDVNFDEEHNPDYFIPSEVAYDYIEPDDMLLKLASSADCISFGTLAQRGLRSRDTLQRLLEPAAEAIKLLDINLRRDCYSYETITQSLAAADLLKLNIEELYGLRSILKLSGESVGSLCDELMDKWSLSHCLVTMAEQGSFVASAKGESVYVPGYQVALCDTLGAGDAFAAGFIHKFLRECPLRECAEFGNALGALAAARKGATASIRAEEIAKMLDSGNGRVVEPALKQFIT